MARFLSLLLWTAVFFLILLSVDQFLVRVPTTVPTHAAVATFYRDLRSRLLDLVAGSPVAPARTPAARLKPAPSVSPKEPATAPPASIESVIEQRLGKTAAPPPAPVKSTGGQPAAASPIAKLAEPATPPASIEAVIDQRQPGKGIGPAKAKPATIRPEAVEPMRRYLYADEQGNLHFAGTLSEVPEQYRGKARLIGEED